MGLVLGGEGKRDGGFCGSCRWEGMVDGGVEESSGSAQVGVAVGSWGRDMVVSGEEKLAVDQRMGSLRFVYLWFLRLEREVMGLVHSAIATSINFPLVWFSVIKQL